MGEDTDRACQSARTVKVINVKLLDDVEGWARRGLTAERVCSREMNQENCFFFHWVGNACMGPKGIDEATSFPFMF